MIPIIESKNRGSDQIRRSEVERGGERECEGESLQLLRAFTGDCPNLNSSVAANVPMGTPTSSQTPVPDPISTYRSLAHLTPNASQRRILGSAVTDLPLWQGTLEHWLMHGWNPRNITGMLELYARGGAAGCRYCSGEHRSRQEAKTAQEHTHRALEDLRRELSLSSQPNEP
jgi:hypothetical protein